MGAGKPGVFESEHRHNVRQLQKVRPQLHPQHRAARAKHSAPEQRQLPGTARHESRHAKPSSAKGRVCPTLGLQPWHPHEQWHAPAREGH